MAVLPELVRNLGVSQDDVSSFDVFIVLFFYNTASLYPGTITGILVNNVDRMDILWESNTNCRRPSALTPLPSSS